MDSSPEIYRLIDLMPASGRMFTKIISKPEQREVIVAPLPLPWQTKLIEINFDLWGRLPKPQRDLLLLRSVCWLTSIQWFKPNLYQVLIAAGTVGTIVEAVQTDVVGIFTAGSLTALAGTQLWRNSRSPQRSLEADEAAIRVAQRRGYDQADAARHLLSGIEAVSQIEDRPSLSFIELLRCQNLRAIARLSPIDVPEVLRRE
jgi:Protein of unknown function (DUF3318)